MSAEALGLAGDAALLALAVAGAFLSRRPFAGTLVYGGSLVLSTLLLFIAIDALLIGARGEPIVLPLGLPWIGARFRIDALSAFFLVVVNLGGATASLYGLGYGRAERSPERVLPFFPAFLASMNLVLVADDAYTFLLSWEFMSLSSWALVMAHHRDHDNARAGYVYLVMASFGTLALLLAFALLAGPAGGYAFDAMRTGGTAGRRRRPRLHSGPDRSRVKGRDRAVARLAAARPSCRAKPRIRAHERGHDESRRLRLHPDRV